MARSIVIVAAALTACAVLGFLIGRWSGELPATTAEAQVHAVAAPSPGTPNPAGDPVTGNEPAATREPSSFAQHDVLSLLQLPSDFDQTAGLYALAAGADAGEIRRHIQDATLIPRTGDRQAALGVLFLRLSDLEPDRVLEHLYDTGIDPRHSAIFTIFNNWAKRDLDFALARLNRLRTDRDRQVAHNAIVQAYDDPAMLQKIVGRLPAGSAGQLASAASLVAKAHVDPASALQAAFELSDPNARAHAIMRIAAEWGATDPVAALEASQTIADPQARRDFRRNVLAAAARSDPERALDLLDRADNRAERQAIVQSAFSQLATEDPHRAIAIATAIDDGQLRRQALGAALGAMAQSDPRAAAMALTDIDDAGLRQQYGYSVAGPYAALAPEEALHWAAALDGTGHGLLNVVLNTVAGSEPTLALAFVSALEPSMLQSQLLSGVLGTIAQTQPEEALTHAERLPAGPVRNQALQAVMNTWVNQDAVAAMEWVLAQSPRERTYMLTHIGHQVANSDLELAISYAEHIEGAARDRWIGSLIHQFAAQNPTRAADWLEQFSGQPEYGNWLATVASQVLVDDPASAMGMIANISEPKQYEMARSRVISAWLQRDPAAVAGWLADEPWGDGYPQIVQQLAGNWHRYDPRAAVRWVEGLGTQELRDTGLAAMVSNGQMEPEQAARLIDQIESEEQRWHALYGQISQMARYDPEGARSFIDRWSMSDERRRQLEEMLNQQQRGW